MDEDRLLREFARLAREEAEEEKRFPEYWEQLAAGTLPEAEEERLRAESVGAEETRAAFEVFSPLGAGFHARVVRNLRGETAQDEASVIPFPTWLRRSWWPRLAVAAVAATVLGLLVFGPPRQSSSLPRFEVLVNGIDRVRSSSVSGIEEPPVLALGSTFRVLLRPQRKVSGRLHARFFVARGEEWREWPLEARIAPSGAFRVQQRLEGDLALAPGVWTLVIAVGRRRHLGPPDEVRKLFESGVEGPVDGGWQLIRRSFEVEAADRG